MSGLGADATAGRQITSYIRADLREVGDRAEGRIEGRAPVSPHLRGAHGGMRTGALLTMLDYAGGFAAGLAALPDGWVVSTNLAARVVAHKHTGPLRIEAEVARRGRSSVVTPVRMWDEGAGDALVADGVLTSAILVPPDGTPSWERPLRIDAQPPVDLPAWEDWLGARAIDDYTVEIDLDDKLRNPWGILHGGVVASLLDLATEQAVRTEFGGGVTADVVVHFLAPNRVGPVRATARPVGRRSDGVVSRVELRDEGADRVTALAVTTART